MGALFSRVKSWISGETLTAVDLNAEFNNILNNLTPAGIDDESANATAMQTVAAPYPGSVISLPTSLQGEIQRIRFMLKSLGMGAQWYNVPVGAIKIGTLTRVMSVASGDDSYTGVGFKPSNIILISGLTAAAAASVGVDNATVHGCVYNNHYSAANTWSLAATLSLVIYEDAGKAAYGIVKTMDADGFTMTWTKVGSPTATLTAIYLAFR